MRRPIVRKILLCSVLAFAVACDDSNTPVTPTQPAPTTTETFSGNLNQNGAVTNPFTTAASGTLTATLKSVGPSDTTAIGLSIGTWNGTACQIVVANDNATQGAVVTGTVSSAGSFCVRVYDIGQIEQTVSFTVEVVHP